MNIYKKNYNSDSHDDLEKKFKKIRGIQRFNSSNYQKSSAFYILRKTIKYLILSKWNISLFNKERI